MSPDRTPEAIDAAFDLATRNAHTLGYKDGYEGAQRNPPAWDTIPEWSDAYAEGYEMGRTARKRIKPKAQNELSF